MEQTAATVIDTFREIATLVIGPTSAQKSADDDDKPLWCIYAISAPPSLFRFEDGTIDNEAIGPVLAVPRECNNNTAFILRLVVEQALKTTADAARCTSEQIDAANDGSLDSIVTRLLVIFYAEARALYLEQGRTGATAFAVSALATNTPHNTTNSPLLIVFDDEFLRTLVGRVYAQVGDHRAWSGMLAVLLGAALSASEILARSTSAANELAKEAPLAPLAPLAKRLKTQD